MLVGCERYATDELRNGRVREGWFLWSCPTHPVLRLDVVPVGVV
jgi:hypothetical protein